jgi:DNA-binding CsgD family transcriptional regulator
LEDKGRASETIIKRLEWELTQMQDKLARKDEETVGKEEFEEKVLTNLKELVNPYLYKLKKSKLNEKQTEYLHIMESNLNQIVSPFSRKLTSNFSNLTHTEVQVANLVMQGKATKEIGEVLNVSGRTIDTHRRRIRNKLGLANKKVNLRSHLLSIQ